jgi:drug/metabolite transporter (DMT)-like permease
MAARMRSSPLVRLGILGVLWGITFPMSRLGVAAGADPFLLVVLSFAVAVAISAPLAALRRSPTYSARRALESMGLGALLIAGINLPLFWGVRFATGGVASIVYATAPLLSLGAARLLGGGARLGSRGPVALALGLGGVLVLGLASGGVAIASAWGLAAFGLGATCQGFGAVAMGRLRPKGEGPWGSTFQFAGGGLASLAVFMGVSPSVSVVWNDRVLTAVLYVGIVSFVIGYALFFDLLRTLGPVGANQVAFLNPVSALALGVLAFGEPFALPELGGLALVLLALTLLQGPGANRGPAPGASGGGGDRTRGASPPLPEVNSARPPIEEARARRTGR